MPLRRFLQPMVRLLYFKELPPVPQVHGPLLNPEIPKFLDPGMSSLTIPSSTSRRPRRDMPQLEPKYNLTDTIPSNSC